MKTAKCNKPYQGIQVGEVLQEVCFSPLVRFYAQRGRWQNARFFPANRIEKMEKCGYFQIS